MNQRVTTPIGVQSAGFTTICHSNSVAERALRGICLGHKSWLFAGSDRGGARAAVMYALIGTAKLNDVDPQAWLADVLARIAEMPQNHLPKLPPWHWKADRQQALAEQLAVATRALPSVLLRE